MASWELIALAAASTVSNAFQASQQSSYQNKVAAMQAQQAQAEIAHLEQQRQTADRERREKLERATAAQRAAFAASGVSSDGSGDAVFENLLTQSEQERAQLDDGFDQRIRGLQAGIQLNLLRRPSSFNPLGELVNLGRAAYQASNRNPSARGDS